MSHTCRMAPAGQATLYYYGELPDGERPAFEQHAAGCDACASFLEELELMRAALSERAEAATRTDEEWAAFMRRLDARLERAKASVARAVLSSADRRVTRHAGLTAWFAVAALLMCAVALGLVWQRRVLRPVPAPAANVTRVAPSQAPLAAAAERHFERARLVVLGIAMKDPAQTGAADWEYERDLAASLLPETRLFRLSAVDRGDARLASLLADLETVLLQASMTTDAEVPELERLQRVIQRRGLLGRMDLREL